MLTGKERVNLGILNMQKQKLLKIFLSTKKFIHAYLLFS